MDENSWIGAKKVQIIQWVLDVAEDQYEHHENHSDKDKKVILMFLCLALSLY